MAKQISKTNFNKNKMLVLIIISLILLIGFILLAVFVQDEYDVWAIMCSFISGIAAVILILVYFVNPLMIKIDIQKFKSFEVTLSNARENTVLSEFERAAIQTKVADWNEWLANVQYRKTWKINNIPNDVNDLKPIK